MLFGDLRCSNSSCSERNEEVDCIRLPSSLQKNARKKQGGLWAVMVISLLAKKSNLIYLSQKPSNCSGTVALSVQWFTQQSSFKNALHLSDLFRLRNHLMVWETCRLQLHGFWLVALCIWWVPEISEQQPLVTKGTRWNKRLDHNRDHGNGWIGQTIKLPHRK